MSKWTELKNIHVASMIFSPIALPLYKQPSVSGTELTQPSVKHHQVIFGTTHTVMRTPQKLGQSIAFYKLQNSREPDCIIRLSGRDCRFSCDPPNSIKHVEMLFCLERWLEEAAALSLRQLDPSGTDTYTLSLKSDTHTHALCSLQSALSWQLVAAIQWNVKACVQPTQHTLGWGVALMLFMHARDRFRANM